MEQIEIIFRLHSEGKSTRQIAEYLNQNNIPVLSGKVGAAWHGGTIAKIIKRGKQGKQETKETPGSKQPEIERVRQANQGILKELDTTKSELAKAYVLIESQKAEIEQLNNTVNRQKSELEKAKQESKQMQLSGSQIQYMINNSIDISIKPLIVEIESLKGMISELKYKPESKQGKQPDKQESKQDRQSGLSILNWNIVESGGYYRAFKTINGKKQGVYIGKVFTPEIAEEKITAALEKNADKWGVDTDKQDSKQGKQETETTGAATDMQALRKEIILGLIKQEGGNRAVGIIPIMKIYEAAGGTGFFEALAELTRELKIELLHGDPRSYESKDLDRLPRDNFGISFINVQLA